MLVIRRKRDQVIRIGDSIEVTVLEIENGQVKLGISAPREIPVFREEIAATRQSNRGSVLSDTGLPAAALAALRLKGYSVPNSPRTNKVSISNASS